jgi:hypothetical protein
MSSRRSEIDIMVDAMFAARDMPRFRDLVATGDLSSVSDADVENYARLATSWTSSGGALTQRLSGYYAGLVIAVLVGGDSHPDLYEVDGEPFVRGDDGDVPVTAAMISHWEHCWVILSEEETAGRFLDLVPVDARQAAEMHAAGTWRRVFERTDG